MVGSREVLKTPLAIKIVIVKIKMSEDKHLSGFIICSGNGESVLGLLNEKGV